MTIYGCNISYYTGKLETYLRYRGHDYELLPTVGNEKKLIAGAGAVQMPVVETDDGRWMTDTTPMIAWLETQQDAPSIYPKDPALRFIALLIEDYADEWLWRPAMHYRWSYSLDRAFACRAIYEDIVKGNRAIPRWLALRLIKRRQLGGFVHGDGVTAKTWDHVERGYLTALDRLEAIFKLRPFILGKTPTIADIGMMGPMLRHFGQDPTPAEIMRERAPSVYEWVARMWNLDPQRTKPQLISKPDAALIALLTEICETHLFQLRQNALAYDGKRKRYSQSIQGCDYINIPNSRYRVWCLEEQRREWADLPAKTQKTLKASLHTSNAAILWEDFAFMPSEYDPERQAPFNKAINVFGAGVPPR